MTQAHNLDVVELGSVLRRRHPSQHLKTVSRVIQSRGEGAGVRSMEETSHDWIIAFED